MRRFVAPMAQHFSKAIAVHKGKEIDVLFIIELKIMVRLIMNLFFL